MEAYRNMVVIPDVFLGCDVFHTPIDVITPRILQGQMCKVFSLVETLHIYD